MWRLLERQYSPGQIAGGLALEGRPLISRGTIYRRAWGDREGGGATLHLRRTAGRWGASATAPRTARVGWRARGRPGERPAGALNRSRQGHWEIDTVVGPGRPALLTPVDRKTGYLHIRRPDDRTAGETNCRLGCLLRRHPRRPQDDHRR